MEVLFRQNDAYVFSNIQANTLKITLYINTLDFLSGFECQDKSNEQICLLLDNVVINVLIL